MYSVISTKTLRVFRAVGIVLALITVIIPYLTPPNGSFDPLWMRFALSGLTIAVVFASYVVPFVRRYMLFFFQGLGTLTCIWLTGLAFSNDLRLDYSPTVIIIIVFAGLTFRDSRALWAFNIAVFGSALAFYPLLETPHLNPIYFLMVELLVLLGLTIAMQTLIVDRRQSRIQEKRLRAMTVSAFEYSDTGILVTDKKGKILEVNPQFLEMFHLTHQKVEEQGGHMPLPSLVDLVVEREAFLAMEQEALEQAQKHLFQEFSLTLNTYFKRFSKPLLLEQKAIGRIWFYHDMTAQVMERRNNSRKRELLEAENAALSELALATSDSEYNLALAVRQIAQIGKDLLKVPMASIWLASEEGDRFQCFLEMDQDVIDEGPDKEIEIKALSEFLGKIAHSRVVPVSKPAEALSYPGLTQQLPELKNRTFLFVPIRPAGKLKGFILALESDLKRKWGDEEMGFAASLGDIGGMIMESLHRRKSENALKKSLQRNKTLVNAVPDLLVRVDLEGHILDLKIPENYVFYKLVRTPTETLTDLFPDALAEEIMEHIKITIDQNAPTELEYQLKYQKIERDLEMRVARSGESEVLVMIRDVTERKTTERELIQRNFELDSFVYRASHDLKAPLNSLMGLIAIMKEESLPIESLTYLKLMDRSVLKLDTFIHNLTEFSRINRAGIKLEKIDLRGLTVEIFESLKYMEGSGDLKKEVVLEQEEPFVGDRFHLEVVLANLISNAIKYQDRQKETPFVRVTFLFEKTHVTIAVEDNGIGIPAHYQDRLFELFFRASNQSFGSGLGLYILRNAVDKLNGIISLDSEEGKGSIFQVTIPRDLTPKDRLKGGSQVHSPKQNPG